MFIQLVTCCYCPAGKFSFICLCYNYTWFPVSTTVCKYRFLVLVQLSVTIIKHIVNWKGNLWITSCVISFFIIIILIVQNQLYSTVVTSTLAQFCGHVSGVVGVESEEYGAFIWSCLVTVRWHLHTLYDSNLLICCKMLNIFWMFLFSAKKVWT